jgi:hypothetical protein
MSQFESIFNSTDPCEVEFSPAEAIATIAAIAGDIDTALSGSEKTPDILAEFWAGLLRGLSSQLEDFDVEACINKYITARKTATLGGIYNAAYRALPDGMKPYTYAISKMAMMIDAELPVGGDEFLAELQTSLGLSDSVAEEAWQGMRQLAASA